MLYTLDIDLQSDLAVRTELGIGGSREQMGIDLQEWLRANLGKSITLYGYYTEPIDGRFLRANVSVPKGGILDRIWRGIVSGDRPVHGEPPVRIRRFGTAPRYRMAYFDARRGGVTTRGGVTQ